MLGLDLTVRLDLPFGAVDMAFIEETIHRALVEARVPVVDVEIEGSREVDSPLPQTLGPPDLPLAPPTRLPGSHY